MTTDKAEKREPLSNAESAHRVLAVLAGEASREVSSKTLVLGTLYMRTRGEPAGRIGLFLEAERWLARRRDRGKLETSEFHLADVADLSTAVASAVREVLGRWPRTGGTGGVLGMSLEDMHEEGPQSVDTLLADILNELGSVEQADKVRAEPLGWSRWVRSGEDVLSDTEMAQPKAIKWTLAAAWARVLSTRDAIARKAQAQSARAASVPVPTMSGLVAVAASGLIHRLNTEATRKLSAGIICQETEQWLHSNEAGERAAILAAWLAMEAHKQWVEGGYEMADRVAIVASKSELIRIGISTTEGSPTEVLEEALAVLKSVRVLVGNADTQKGSCSLVMDYFRTEERSGKKGGRPSAAYVVSVGWPLMPQRLEALADEQGVKVPRELAFYGPVLLPAWAPLTGNKRTHRVQRVAWSIGAGQWLVSRREEYAERGGVKLDTLKPYLKSLGLYERTHASLAEDVRDMWLRPPEQLSLAEMGPRGPLLVPAMTEGHYRLGPDFESQHRLIMRAADISDSGRRRRLTKRSDK